MIGDGYDGKLKEAMLERVLDLQHRFPWSNWFVFCFQRANQTFYTDMIAEILPYVNSTSSRNAIIYFS